MSLIERVGVVAAASDCGLHATQIHQWRAKATYKKSVSERMRQLAEKSEEVEFKEKTAAYCAKKLNCSTKLFTTIDQLTAPRINVQSSASCAVAITPDCTEKGTARLTRELEAEGMIMNRKTVAERMRRQGLWAHPITHKSGEFCIGWIMSPGGILSGNMRVFDSDGRR